MSGATTTEVKSEGFMNATPGAMAQDGVKLTEISIDDALSYIGKMDNQMFMTEVQRMQFKVSFSENW